MSKIDWFADNIAKRVRFWSDKEWSKLNSKERIWMWYKHHWFIKNAGSTELDIVTNPLKEIVLYSGVIITTITTFIIATGIEVNQYFVVAGVLTGLTILWIINWIFQWYIGEWKDKKDLISLENETGNKRQKIYRKLEKSMEGKK